MKVKCPHCGSRRVQCRVGWVYLNTQKLVDIDWEGVEYVWCESCKTEIEAGDLAHEDEPLTFGGDL